MKFTLYWKDGKREVVEGNNLVDAFTKAGYGAGATKALDFHANGDNNTYKWDRKRGEKKYSWCLKW